MNEKNPHDIFLDELRNYDTRAIAVEELEKRVPELLGKGLKVFIICRRGATGGRGSYLSNLLVIKKIPTAFLDRGIKHLSEINPDERNKGIETISQIPVVISTISQRDIEEMPAEEIAVYQQLKTRIPNIQEPGFDDKYPDITQIITAVKNIEL